MTFQETGQATVSAGRAETVFPDDVSAAVVAYNATATLPVCMQGLADAGCPAARITVYDVASTDGTGDWMASNHPGVKVVRLDENKGPNPARSLAVLESPTPFVLVVDADVQLTPDTVIGLRQAIGADDRIAVATPVIVFADRPDRVQYSRSWVHFLAEASAETDAKPLSKLGGRTERVGLASGCAPLIRKQAAIDVGLFEERYFFGKTDGEFAFRITLAGYDIVEPAPAYVLHHHHKRGSAYFMHQLCNRWHFMLKDFQLRTLIVILPVLLPHELALFFLMLVMGKIGEYFKALRALSGMLRTLRHDRKQVASMRRRHDWQVLHGDHLVVPVSIGRVPMVSLLIGLYRAVLSIYWRYAAWLLGRASRPLPGGDQLVMGPDRPKP